MQKSVNFHNLLCFGVMQSRERMSCQILLGGLLLECILWHFTKKAMVSIFLFYPC